MVNNKKSGEKAPSKAIIILTFLLFIVGVAVFSLIIPFSFIFLISGIISYILLIIVALVLGYLCSLIIQKITTDNNINILAGIISPILAISCLFGTFESFLILNRKFTSFQSTGSLTTVTSLINPANIPNKFIIIILFFIIFNLPFLYYLNKKEEFTGKYLLWYLLAPVLIFLACFVAYLINIGIYGGVNF